MTEIKPFIIFPDDFKNFEKLFLYRDDIKKLKLIPIKSDEMQRKYHNVSKEELLNGINFNGKNIILLENQYKYMLPEDIWQGIIWIKEGTNETEVIKFINGLKMMSKEHGKYIFDHACMEWKDFYGFKANKKFNFLMIRFQCSDTMRFYHNRSRDGILEVRIDGRNEKFQLYESNFDPLFAYNISNS